MAGAPPPQDPRQELAATINRVYRRGMTTSSGGNISIREANDIWITPAGRDKGTLGPEDIVCVRPDGSISGGGRPSSELPVHNRVYERCPAFRAVIHAHAPALVAFSICHSVPETAVLAGAFDLCGRVGYVPYELTGSDRLGQRVAGVSAA